MMKGIHRTYYRHIDDPRLIPFSPIPPYRIDTLAATVAVEKETASKVLHLKHAEAVNLDL